MGLADIHSPQTAGASRKRRRGRLDRAAAVSGLEREDPLDHRRDDEFGLGGDLWRRPECLQPDWRQMHGRNQRRRRGERHRLRAQGDGGDRLLPGDGLQAGVRRRPGSLRRGRVCRATQDGGIARLPHRRGLLERQAPGQDEPARAQASCRVAATAGGSVGSSLPGWGVASTASVGIASCWAGRGTGSGRAPSTRLCGRGSGQIGAGDQSGVPGSAS